MQRTYCTEFDTIIPAIALTLKPIEDAPHRKAGGESRKALIGYYLKNYHHPLYHTGSPFGVGFFRPSPTLRLKGGSKYIMLIVRKFIQIFLQYQNYYVSLHPRIIIWARRLSDFPLNTTLKSTKDEGYLLTPNLRCGHWWFSTTWMGVVTLRGLLFHHAPLF